MHVEFTKQLLAHTALQFNYNNAIVHHSHTKISWSATIGLGPYKAKQPEFGKPVCALTSLEVSH